MVGRRRRRVAAVVGGDGQQVSRSQRLEDLLEPAVEVLEAAMKVDGVSMPPELVGLDEVHEYESVVELVQQLHRLVDPVDVGLGRKGLIDVAAGKDVADLAHRVNLLPAVADE